MKPVCLPVVWRVPMPSIQFVRQRTLHTWAHRVARTCLARLDSVRSSSRRSCGQTECDARSCASRRSSSCSPLLRRRRRWRSRRCARWRSGRWTTERDRDLRPLEARRRSDPTAVRACDDTTRNRLPSTSLSAPPSWSMLLPEEQRPIYLTNSSLLQQ